MSGTLFTSAREKRLWLGAGAVVLAIYATLGVAPALAGLLRDRGLLGVCFSLGTLLVWATILTQGLKLRPRCAEVGVGLGITAVYLLVFVRISIPEERTHLIEYGVVAVLVYEALQERARHGRRVPVPPLLAVLATSLLGAVDEGIQARLPGRVFASRDILFNVLASALAVGAMVALGRAREWTARRRGG